MRVKAGIIGGKFSCGYITIPGESEEEEDNRTANGVASIIIAWSTVLLTQAVLTLYVYISH